MLWISPQERGCSPAKSSLAENFEPSEADSRPLGGDRAGSNGKWGHKNPVMAKEDWAWLIPLINNNKK